MRWGGAEPGRTRSWRVVAALLGVAVIAVLVAPEVARTLGHARPAGARTPPSTASALGSPTPAQAAAAAPAALVDRAAIADVLARRGAAVTGGDEAAFLATVDPAASQLRTEQAQLFRNLRRIDPTRWAYSLAEIRTEVPTAVRDRLGGTAVLAHVVLRYRLPRVDQVDAVRNEWLTFVERPDGWKLAGTGDGVSLGLRTDVDVWDLASVSVASGDRSLVISAYAPASGYVEEVDAAVQRVEQVWTHPWSGTVAVLVPASETDMAEVLDEHEGGLSQIAAVTTGRVSAARTPATADRVVLNPSTFAGLSALGRRVVLAHEITHVATRAITTTSLPMWLSEGFADYIGYRGTGVPVSVAASDVVRAVREDQIPADLPADAAFDADTADISPAYEQSWLAVRLLAQLYGPAKVADFYYAAASSRLADGRQAVDDALRRVLGISRATLVQRWRDQLADLG